MNSLQMFSKEWMLPSLGWIDQATMKPISFRMVVLKATDNFWTVGWWNEEERRFYRIAHDQQARVFITPDVPGIITHWFDPLELTEMRTP